MAITMLFTVAVAVVATLSNVHAQQYTSPAGCTLGNCDLYFKWEMANGFMNMTMSGRTSGWIAIGYSSDQEMGGGDDMITAYIDGLGVPQVENRHAEGTRRTPIVDSPDVAALSGIEGSRAGDTVTVKFSRKLETGAGADVDLDMSTCPSVFLFFATGPGSNGAIQQHPNNGQSGAPRITDTTVNVCATAVVSASSAQIRDKKLITHGALMIAGWLGLSTTASYFARYMKHLGPFWFSVHRNLQILVVIVVSISGIVIASAKRDTPWSSHQKLGIAVFAFMIWQFLLGMFRNLISGYNAEDFKRTGFRGPRRVYFNFLHRSTGYLLLPLSAAAVYTGMKLLDLDNDAWMLYWAWVAVVAAFIVISEFMALRAARFSQGGKPVPDSSRSLARHAAALFAALMFALAATIIVFVAALA